MVTENIFESRYRHAKELIKMGADIKIKGKTAIIKGVERLNGARVLAEDLRGGAALVIAGLNADGVTVVENVYHVKRGYMQMDE